MNNLKKFATEAEYTAATLTYPAVSWVTATDNVHFDKSAPTPPTPTNDKVMIASYGGGGLGKFIFYNCEASTSSDITAITLDDVAVEPITCQTASQSLDTGLLHIAKYDLSGTTVGDWCSGNLGCMYSSNYAHVDILYPSQITEVRWPENTKNMVVEAETPPYVEGLQSSFQGDGIYVPDSAVDAYKAASEWGSKAEIIFPISEYQGNLPV